MTMTRSLRRFALTVHLTSSVGWVGAVVAYLALGLSAVTSQEAQTVRAAYVAMEVIGWFVIVPLALAALLTGLIMALGTSWGLLRHYWVVITLVLTLFSTVILLLHMPTVSALAEVARAADGAGLSRLGGDLFHSGLGLVVLLVITVLNVYKPRGLTRYGWRKQNEQRRVPPPIPPHGLSTSRSKADTRVAEPPSRPESTDDTRAGPDRESTTSTLIDLHQVSKFYDTPSGPLTALHDVNLHVRAGEFVAVVGKSGSGKTTLLNVLAGIDRPTGGTITVDGTRVDALPEAQLAPWRGRTIGLVFQFFQLLPTLTVAENVMLPMDFVTLIPAVERHSRALELLECVGIRDQADELPARLSGGQQQRAALARALANDPPILLADEPTGNLDETTGTSVLELFARLNAAGCTILVVTHERDISRYASRRVTLVDGRVADDAPT